ncbi:MAG: hypothetical protein JSU63_18695 [Phycisphaerales bacterium]|nr:MAG: hypothetical protein JSU63_18695 [Phycisphaerales bacterium]
MESSLPPSRFALGFCAILIIPALFVLDGVTALVLGWVPQSRLDLAILCAASLVLLLFCVGLLIRKVRAWVGAKASKLMLCTCTLVMAWLVAELVVGAFFEDAIDFHTRGQNLQVIVRPDPALMPGLRREVRYTTNSRGVRGPEFPPRADAYRILCVGGSTTECNYMDDEDTWFRLIMNRLNAEEGMQPVWVGGVGYAGYTTREHIHFIRESSLAKEVDCIVSLIGVNDFQSFLAPLRREWDDVAQPIWRRSRVIDGMRVVARKLAPWPNLAINDVTGDVYTLRRQRRRSMELVDTLPDLTEALRDYKQRIRAMAELADKLSVRLVFATQPYVWRDDLPPEVKSRLWFGWMKGEKSLSINKLRIGMELFNQALVSVCNEIGVPCIDLSHLNGNESLYIDDCHFTIAGTRTVADALATWFLDHRNGERWAE